MYINGKNQLISNDVSNSFEMHVGKPTNSHEQNDVIKLFGRIMTKHIILPFFIFIILAKVIQLILYFST